MREEADFGSEDFNDNNMYKGIHVRFYMHPVKDEAASIEAGRPVYKDVEFVEKFAPGNSNNIPRGKVTDMDRRIFAAQYAKFKQGDQEQIVGTPLTEWSLITRSQVEELAYIKCRTVEQLAEINDQACNAMPGLYDLKRKAKAFIERAKDNAPIEKLMKENADLLARVASLEESLKLPVAKKA